MSPEAQRAAVQRLALRGWDARSIGSHTGMQEAEVHRILAGALPDYLQVREKWDRPRGSSSLSLAS